MKKRIFKVLFFFILGILLFVGYFILHAKTGFGIPCLIHKTTGYYCPGCGLTRMLFALLKLDIPTAFRYNQLLFILLPFFLMYFIYRIYLFIWDKKDKILVKIPKIYSILLLILVIVWGIVRNLNIFPFLRP